MLARTNAGACCSPLDLCKGSRPWLAPTALGDEEHEAKQPAARDSLLHCPRGSGIGRRNRAGPTIAGGGTRILTVQGGSAPAEVPEQRQLQQRPLPLSERLQRG